MTHDFGNVADLFDLVSETLTVGVRGVHSGAWDNFGENPIAR